jgi:hypothetical protein
MICPAKRISKRPKWHHAFLVMLPKIRRHAVVAFRHRLDAGSGRAEEGRGDEAQRLARGRFLVGRSELDQEMKKAQ